MGWQADVTGASSSLNRAQATSAFVLVVLTWASMPLFMKYLTAYMDGWVMNGLRYSIAVLIWLPYLAFQWRAGRLTQGLFRDALAPALCHWFGQACWGLSPYHNDASIMHFIGRSTFFFMIMFGFILLKEERRLMRQGAFWLGALGTVAGVLFMYQGGAEVGSTSIVGVLLLLGAGMGWAAYGVTIKKFMGAHGARQSFAVVSLYTAPGLWLMMALWGDSSVIAGLAWSTWGWLVLSAVLGIALAHVLLYVVVKQFGPIVSDGVFQLIPFVTVVGAYILFDEAMTGLQWIGGCVLILAAYALLLAKRRSMQER